jgi:hypothetical protein
MLSNEVGSPFFFSAPGVGVEQRTVVASIPPLMYLPCSTTLFFFSLPSANQLEHALDSPFVSVMEWVVTC